MQLCHFRAKLDGNTSDSFSSLFQPPLTLFAVCLLLGGHTHIMPRPTILL